MLKVSNKYFDKLNANHGKNTSNYIIKHNANTTMYFLVNEEDRPWFPNIKQTKQNKAEYYPCETRRCINHRDKKTSEFINTHPGMIMDANISANTITNPDTENAKNDDENQISSQGQ